MSQFTLSSIDSLLENAPFEVSTISILEEYLKHQLSSQTYHFESNKILLKNYQINTIEPKPELIAQILLLSLMRLPTTDYLALSYIIPISSVNHPFILHIAKVADLLERGQYREFWAEYSSAPVGLFTSATGFIGAIRSFILQSLSNTFKNLPGSSFAEYLGLPYTELSSFQTASQKVFTVYMIYFILLH